MCITKACEEPTAEGVWWRDDAQWRQYDAAQAATIQRAIRDGAKRVQLGNLASFKYARGASYEVDLTTMKQHNLATGYTRDVKIVVNAPSAGNSVNSSDPVARLIDEVRACQETMQSLKQKVEKLEASDFLLAFKVYSAATSTIGKALEHIFKSCKSAWEYLPDSSSDDDYLPDSSSDDDYLPDSSSDDDYLPDSSSDDDYLPDSSSDDDYLPDSSSDDDYLPDSSSDDDYLPDSSSDDDYLPNSSSDDDYLPDSSSNDDFWLSDDDYCVWGT